MDIRERKMMMENIILEMHASNLWKKYLEEIRQNKYSCSNVLLIERTEFYTQIFMV